jgi:sec-independent protein translocase protein TatC
MTLLAIPICILYFLSGAIALLVDKKRRKRNSDPIDTVGEIDKPEKI